MRIFKVTDQSHRVILPSKIVRAFWSERRAWHGDKVSLHVETRYVPDGTPVEIAIWEEDHGADDFIETIENPGVINNGRLIIEHEIDWSAEALGDDLALEGGRFEFYFLASIPDFDITKKSTLLYVDLDEFDFSR